MTIENSIKMAMARMIERKLGIKDVVVTSWQEDYDTYAYDGCETCGPEYETEYNVTIRYVTPPGDYGKVFTYSGKFTSLIKELDA